MVSSIAEISLAEAHVDLQIIGNIKSFSQSEQLLAHLLVVVLHEGTSLLVVTGSSLHALSLSGDTVVIVSKVLVQALNFLRRKRCVSVAQLHCNKTEFAIIKHKL